MKRDDVFVKNRVRAFLVLCVVASAAAYADDFNGADWGMKMDRVQVVVNNELTYYESDSFSVLGTGTITRFDRDCIAIYFFSRSGNLVKGGYFFRPGYPDGEMYRSDYDRLADLMAVQNGDGQERLMWHTDWHYEPREYMKAVKNGDLTLMSVWETESSYIELALSGDRNGYNLSLQFFSRTLYSEYVEMLLEDAMGSGQPLN